MTGRTAGTRIALLTALAAVALAGGGCTVGSGAGAAKGPLFVLGCGDDGSDYRSDAFDLRPTFFAGEPIEDIAVGAHANRLLIRLSRTGNGIEGNDTMYVDVINAYEVARCLRGSIISGVASWDQRHVITADGLQTGQVWCDWSGTAGTDAGVSSDAGTADAGAATADGGAPALGGTRARIFLGPQEYVRASLVPLYTCQKAREVGISLSGWIDFADFGEAVQTSTDPAQRPAVGTDFRVDFTQRLRATFHVVLDDQRVINAIKDRDPVLAPRIGGTLDGFFDFDLDRGRAAQPFP